MKNKGLIIILCLIIIALTLSNVIFILKYQDSKKELEHRFIINSTDARIIYEQNIEIGELENQVEEYKEVIKKYESNDFQDNIVSTFTGELKEAANNAVDNLNESVFLTDFENYNPTDETMITAEKAKEIAQYGFEESAKRIAGEGADNVESEQVKLEEVYANNYFTRKDSESDKIYSNIHRACYVVQRENEMGCGIKIYVDITTGLIIGGAAYGD